MFLKIFTNRVLSLFSDLDTPERSKVRENCKICFCASRFQKGSLSQQFLLETNLRIKYDIFLIFYNHISDLDKQEMSKVQENFKVGFFSTVGSKPASWPKLKY